MIVTHASLHPCQPRDAFIVCRLFSQQSCALFCLWFDLLAPLYLLHTNLSTLIFLLHSDLLEVILYCLSATIYPSLLQYTCCILLRHIFSHLNSLWSTPIQSYCCLRICLLRSDCFVFALSNSNRSARAPICLIFSSNITWVGSAQPGLDIFDNLGHTWSTLSSAPLELLIYCKTTYH